MARTDLIVEKASLENVRLIEELDSDVELTAGQVLVEVERFGLTANNISYAGAGDMLGYWAFFPAPELEWGRVPAWGYAAVTRSEHADMPVGERIFGYVPMAIRFVLEADHVSDLCFFDASAHRAASHPWYNRYYRTGSDPVSGAGFDDVQPVLWALFMTGWELANDFIDSDNHGAGSVLIASASSKTAYSMAHCLAAADTGIEIVGLTSASNDELVRSFGCYDRVLTYDSLDLGSIDGPAAFVDMAGNGALTTEVHAAFGDRLTKSYRVGGTHRHARGGGGALAGPEPKFFFIPDVAEQHAAAEGHAAYHQRFADAWARFAEWVSGWLDVRTESGPMAIQAAYLDALASGARPTEALVLTLD